MDNCPQAAGNEGRGQPQTLLWDQREVRALSTSPELGLFAKGFSVLGILSVNNDSSSHCVIADAVSNSSLM